MASDEGADGRVARPIDAAWAAIPVLLPALVMLIDRMRAIDLAYHVRLGTTMLEAGSVVRSDTLSFSAAGTSWVDQQWLAQVVLALVHGAGGWALVWVLRAGLASLAMGLVYLACRGAGARPATASGLTIASFVVAYPNLGMRPQMLAVACFAAGLWAVTGRRAHPGRMAILPVTALLVVNMHGSFPLIVVLGVLATAEDLIDRDPAWRRTMGWTVAALAATFLTPFGAGAWSYVLDIATDPQIRDAVTEWAPLDATDPSGALTMISVVTIAVWFARRGRPVAWRALIWLGAFLVPALLTQRSVVWWALVFPVVVAGCMDPARSRPQPTRAESPMPARVVIVTLLAGVALALPWFRSTPEDQMLDDAPPGLTAAVREDLPDGTRTLIHQPWASWFEYAVPTIPVFVDSRIELYPFEVWEAYDDVAFDGSGWAEALETWDVEAIVAETEWPLLPRLREAPGWRVAYEDEDGVLLVRT